MAELADSLFELSWDGLARWEPDAQRLLTPLRKPIEQRRCPGDELRGLKGDVEAILKKSRLIAGA